MADGSGRRPASVYGVGDEPDPRFSLANERTFLAWIRTSLALVAGGLGLVVFVSDKAGTTALAAVFVMAGALLSVNAWRRWAAIERALRLRAPLPGPGLGAPLAYTVALVAIAIFLITVVLG